MKVVSIIAPELGEGVTHVTVARWGADIGDEVTADEIVVEMATDKAAFDVPSPATGILVRRFFEDEDEVEVGTVIGEISADE